MRGGTVWVTILMGLSLATSGRAQSPRIDRLSADTLPRSGRLVIDGSGFSSVRGDGDVRIDDASAWVTAWSDDRIVAYVPEAARLGASPVEVVTAQGTSNAMPLEVTARRPVGRVRWRFALDSDYLLHRPAVGLGGTVYVNDVGGHVYALSPGGALQWIFDTGGQGAQGPVAVGPDGSVYVVGDPLGPDVNLYALDPAGHVQWVFTDTETTGVIAGPAVGPNGNVYVVTEAPGRGVIALSPAGELLWSHPGDPVVREYGPIGAEIVFGPSVPGANVDRLYLAFDLDVTEPPRLYSFDLQGNQHFAIETGAQADIFLQRQAQPAVGPLGHVYLTSSRTGFGWVLEQIDPAGTVDWQYQSWPANGMSMPDVSGAGGVFLTHSLAHLVRVGAGGSEVWHVSDGNQHAGPIVTPDGEQLVVGGKPDFGQPGFFRGYSVDGRLLWQLDLPRENGGQLVPDTRALVEPRGLTAYAGAVILADGGDYSYLYAIALDPELGLLPKGK